MSKGVKWLLLSMLVSLSRGKFCRNNGNCSCLISYWKWEIRCPSDSSPKFIAHYRNTAATIQVECYNATSWSDFKYQMNFPYQRQWRTTLTIERCPLPDKFFAHITKKFGFDWPIFLTFTSHMNLSSTLTRRHLSMMPALQTLNLSSNGLTELPSDLFRDIDNLKELDLSYNEIEILSRYIFYGLPTLRKIDLSHNAIKFVDWILFGSCRPLNQLSLRGNLLTSLDHRTFRECNWLYLIDLAENLLETLPPDAFKWTTVQTLDISGNRFTTLPEELFSLTELTELTLSHNHANSMNLPMNFLNNLTKLEKVILIRNNLTSLPENIFWESYSLQSVDLHGNTLCSLPEDIFRDSGMLSFLDLSDNGLTHVPKGLFRALRKLRKLNLARNRIASLSRDMFKNLDSLLELNIEFNKMTNIDWTTFAFLQNIRLIRLSHNFIELINIRECFEGTPIQEIFLDHNNLTGQFSVRNLHDKTTANLLHVDVTYNQISELLVWSPVVGDRDVKYDVRHNTIRDIYLPEEIFSKVSILVDDNPLHCGCKMDVLLKYMHKPRGPQSRENLEFILGSATCSEPYWMKSIPVASLRLDNFTCRPDDDYRHVRCAEGCDCWWRPHDRKRIVDCSSRHFSKMPDEIVGFVDENGSENDHVLETYVDRQSQWYDWRNAPVELELASNSLTEIPPLNESIYEYVELLVLSYNNVSRLSFDMLPARLKILRVDHNDLRTLNATTVEAMMKSTSLSEVNLEKNPWNCDAGTRNGLASLEGKFGKNVQYSFDVKTCLDSRQATSPGKTDRLYISFVRF